MALMATALLQPFDSDVYGEITFVESDDGSTLTVFGTASGLRRAGRYVSLVHGLYSNGDLDPPYTPPGPCMPDDVVVDGDDNLSIGPRPTDLVVRPAAITHLLLGGWRGLMGIQAGASRILRVAKPTVFPHGLHLYEMHTVSIREVVRRLPRMYRGTEKRLFSLIACGQIRRTP